MALPAMSFKEFVKNPIVALLFMALTAIGYLYYDNKTTLTNQIEDLKIEVNTLKEENKELRDNLIEISIKINKEED